MLQNTDVIDRRGFVRAAGGLAITTAAGCGADRIAALTHVPQDSDATAVIPDLLDDASFETGWDGFTDFGGGPPVGVTRFGQLGGRAALFQWSASRVDVGAQFARMFLPQDRICVRFEFQISNGVSTIWKFCRTREPGFNGLLGGLFVRNGARMITWGFDAEVSAQDIEIGIARDQVVDGGWHSIEFDYWRNGDPSGYPSVAIWLDGVRTVGTTRPPAPARWINGRLNAGERRGTARMGLIALMGTLNGGNATSGQCRVDHVSISSRGRIGV